MPKRKTYEGRDVDKRGRINRLANKAAACQDWVSFRELVFPHRSQDLFDALDRKLPANKKHFLLMVFDIGWMGNLLNPERFRENLAQVNIFSLAAGEFHDMELIDIVAIAKDFMTYMNDEKVTKAHLEKMPILKPRNPVDKILLEQVVKMAAETQELKLAECVAERLGQELGDKFFEFSRNADALIAALNDKIEAGEAPDWKILQHDWLVTAFLEKQEDNLVVHMLFGDIKDDVKARLVDYCKTHKTTKRIWPMQQDADEWIELLLDFGVQRSFFRNLDGGLDE